MLYGYHPTFQVTLPTVAKVPATEDRLKGLKEVQEDTRAALDIAAERMKCYYD